MLEDAEPHLAAPAAMGMDEREAARAFAVADRACRLPGSRSGRDYLLRALALHRLGRAAECARDLDEANKRSGFAIDLLRALIALHPSQATRTQAARRLLDHPAAQGSDAALALSELDRSDQAILVVARRMGRRVAGRVWFRGPAEPHLQAITETAVNDLVLPRAPERDPARLAGAAFALEIDPVEAVTLAASLPDGTADSLALVPAGNPAGDLSRFAAVKGPPDRLTVIIPVYRDAAMTRACLASVAAQTGDRPVDIIVVDDCSPEPEVSALAATFCAEQGAHCLVNRVNQGFTASVNRALALARPGDVLLLNADVVLPPDALLRMTEAAYAAPDIGTVTPFSNDSEWSTFPRPMVPVDLRDARERRRIDEAARAAHGSRVVDTVFNIGFCLYVTARCLAATGLLNPIYERGYFEDLELCLKAREHGLRNVVAVGLYVGHGSGRSFQEASGLLVSRNLPLLQARFPAFMRDNAAAAEADPLAPARAAIEARLPPEGPVRLILGSPARLGPLLAERAAAAAEAGARTMTLALARASGIIACRGWDGGPHALDFPAGETGLRACAAYLGALRLDGVEIGEPDQMPEVLWRLLDALAVPISVLVSGREALLHAPSTVDRLTAAGRVPVILATDAMAEAACLRRFEPESAETIAAAPAPAGRRGPVRRLGCLVPVPEPAVDALLLALGRAARLGNGPDIIVLGRCIDDRRIMAGAPVHATGPVAFDETAALAQSYGVDGLFMPYRTRFFGFLESLAARLALPRLGFDWTEGAWPRMDGDVMLDPALSDSAAAAAVCAWCAGADPHG